MCGCTHVLWVSWEGAGPGRPLPASSSLANRRAAGLMSSKHAIVVPTQGPAPLPTVRVVFLPLPLSLSLSRSRWLFPGTYFPLSFLWGHFCLPPVGPQKSFDVLHRDILRMHCGICPLPACCFKCFFEGWGVYVMVQKCLKLYDPIPGVPTKGYIKCMPFCNMKEWIN